MRRDEVAGRADPANLIITSRRLGRCRSTVVRRTRSSQRVRRRAPSLRSRDHSRPHDLRSGGRQRASAFGQRRPGRDDVIDEDHLPAGDRLPPPGWNGIRSNKIRPARSTPEARLVGDAPRWSKGGQDLKRMTEQRVRLSGHQRDARLAATAHRGPRGRHRHQDEVLAPGRRDLDRSGEQWRQERTDIGSSAVFDGHDRGSKGTGVSGCGNDRRHTHGARGGRGMPRRREACGGQVGRAVHTPGDPQPTASRAFGRQDEVEQRPCAVTCPPPELHGSDAGPANPGRPVDSAQLWTVGRRNAGVWTESASARGLTLGLLVSARVSPAAAPRSRSRPRGPARNHRLARARPRVGRPRRSPWGRWSTPDSVPRRRPG